MGRYRRWVFEEKLHLDANMIQVMLEDKLYSKFGGVITCRNISYYSHLDIIVKPKHVISVKTLVAYRVNS